MGQGLSLLPVFSMFTEYLTTTLSKSILPMLVESSKEDTGPTQTPHTTTLAPPRLHRWFRHTSETFVDFHLFEAFGTITRCERKSPHCFDFHRVPHFLYNRVGPEAHHACPPFKGQDFVPSYRISVVFVLWKFCVSAKK